MLKQKKANSAAQNLAGYAPDKVLCLYTSELKCKKVKAVTMTAAAHRIYVGLEFCTFNRP